jgi:NADPH-dependent ferric siderophore reductase
MPTEQQDAVHDPVAAMSAIFIEHLNDQYGDAVLVLARAASGDGVTSARGLAVDRDGVDVEIARPDGTTVERVAFLEPVHHTNDVVASAVALLAATRQRLGITEPSSLEVAHAAVTGIRTLLTQVTAVEQLTPGLRQITFGGGDLATFEPLGPDQFLYVLAPPRGRDELTIGRDFSWEGWDDIPEADRPVGAYYTVRRWRRESHELDVVFVLHGDVGEASAWARRAEPGDAVALWGPREAFEPPLGTDWYLLVADETGMPAVAAILEWLPEGSSARVILEVADAGEQLPLVERPGVEVTWLHRDGAEPGTGTALLDAVRGVAWPDGVSAYAWGGAESHLVTAIRKYVRNEMGLNRDAVSMTGYWRRDGDHTDGDHTDGDGDDDEFDDD